MELIRLNNINVLYQNTCALKDINMVIYKGDYINITGPNGGGKTTLLKIIIGMVKPFSGHIYFSEQLKIGYVPQHTVFDRSFPIKAVDVVMMGMLNKPKKIFHEFTKEEIKEAEKTMDQLGILSIKNAQISSLSGGQLQKVLFCRAVLTNPNILVLDEPASNLDFESRGLMNAYLDDISKKVTIVKVSHEEKVSTLVNKIVYVSQSLKVENRG